MPLLLLSNPVGACDWAAPTTASTTTDPAMTRDLIIFPPGPLGVRTSDYGGRATAPKYLPSPTVDQTFKVPRAPPLPIVRGGGAPRPGRSGPAHTRCRVLRGAR